MNRRRFKNPLFLFYLLVIYVVTQFSWWLYLIATLYHKIYADPSILEKKILMLVGEGSVFVIILFGGLFMIRRAYQKENELKRMQENFLFSVSHELKTPVSSIKLFLQTLRTRELDNARKDEIYALSLVEIQRLESLVSNLLITRSIENRNYFLDKQALQLDEFIRKLVHPLQSTTLKDHRIELRLSPVEMSADREAMTSIISNLLQNAAKYSPRGSTIEIRLYKDNEVVFIEVSDQGVGIADEQKEKVFNRFYRIENEMTRKSKGTGLGLFITRFLVEQHHGTITLKSNHPVGLTVCLGFNIQKNKQ